MAKAAGRGNIPVSIYPKATPADIERAGEAGVERCIYYVPPDGREQAMSRLEELARLTRPYAE
jgi:hypothetical protein